MVIFKNIVNYPLPTTLVAQTMVFPITEGPLLITNIVAMLAPPLDFRGNKSVVLGLSRLYVDETAPVLSKAILKLPVIKETYLKMKSFI